MLLGLALPADAVHANASAAKTTPTTKTTTAAKATTPAKTTTAAKATAPAKTATTTKATTPAKTATTTKATTPAKTTTTTKAAATSTKAATPTGKTTTLAETTPTLATRLAAVKTAKSINYYPAGAGWSKMWTSWDAAKVDADLAKAAALGATNVRAIIFPNTFGYPTPHADYTSRLARFVNMAGARGMTVRVTLFDWWDGYSEVTNSVNWATALLTPYRNDSRVISVELQNEFNPSDTKAVAWAKKVVPAVRGAFPTMPLTFSVDGTTGIPGMVKIKSVLGSTPVDFYDYHFYGNSERALTMIKKAQAAVAPAPLVIGEVGLNTLQNTEGEQAAFLARVFQAAAMAGVQSVSPWTLTDFAQGAIPDSLVAKLPAQYSYGLYRTNGTAKPAAAVVKAGWTATAMPTDLLDNGFEAAAGQSAWRPFLPELGLGVKTQSQVRSGKWSLSFSNSGKNASGVPSWRVAPITAVQPNQKWHAEVWARGKASTGTNQIALSWFDVNDKWLGGASSASLPAGTTNWTKLTADGPAPAGAASMQVHVKSGENDGTIWFDDVLVSAA